ncbi:hypothetical protein M0805_006654 [Coniferiporia weirii]|nr:hypothetical protein M0805_006654 [Coniferiporia weirii]
MSEYWVSHKKYFCKYCEIYIADDAPSRRQHETGLRHKGNTERFVRNLYKQGERRKKDLEEEKREMVRVEQAASAAFARDVSSGHASVASTSRLPEPGPSVPSSKKPERPTSVWSNYSTAQSLGYEDPDSERLKAEMERRRTQGMVGEWETVAPPPPPLPNGSLEIKKEETKEGVLADAAPQKREAEALPEDDDDGRQFKLRRRTLGAGLADIWDPGDIPIKIKSRVKEEEQLPFLAAYKGNSESAVLSTSASGRSDGQTPVGPAGEAPKWKPMGWKRATVMQPTAQAETKKETEEQGDELQSENPLVKEETEPDLINTGRRPALHQSSADTTQEKAEGVGAMPVKLETKEEEIAVPSAPESSGALFKKRKIPAGGRGRR